MTRLQEIKMDKVGITAIASGAFATLTQVSGDTGTVIAVAVVAITSAGFFVLRDVLKKE